MKWILKIIAVILIMLSSYLAIKVLGIHPAEYCGLFFLIYFGIMFADISQDKDFK